MFRKIMLFAIVFSLIFSLAYAVEKNTVKRDQFIHSIKSVMGTPQKASTDQSAIKYLEQIKSAKGKYAKLQGMSTWRDGFESGFDWVTWGTDHNWDRTADNPHRGDWCAWCSETTRDAGEDNYPNYCDANMGIPVQEMQPYIKWITFDFYYDMDIERNYDFFTVRFWAYDAATNAWWWLIPDDMPFTGSSDGYKKYKFDFAGFEPAVLVENITHVGAAFTFTSDYSVTGPGVWIDDVKVRQHFYNPTTVDDFEGMPIAGLAPLTVEFMQDCGGVPNKFFWEYGDGGAQKIRQGWPNWMPHQYIYQNAGEYSVKLTATSNSNSADLTIPNMIYADAKYDYLPLTIIDAGDTWPGEEWENAIDHDVYGSGAIAAAVATDPRCEFMIADENEKDVYKIRLLVDTAEDHQYATVKTKDYKITLTDTKGVNFVIDSTSTKLNGNWDEIDVTVLNEGAPVVAKYIKLELLTARGGSAYRELAEFQVFGTEVGALPKGMPKAATELPTTFDLAQNYPNPFNPATSISFQLPENAEVELSIYNVQGQLVRTLVNGSVNAGQHSFTWNAVDMNGQAVAGGVYIYKLQAIGESKVTSFTKKMILMK